MVDWSNPSVGCSRCGHNEVTMDVESGEAFCSKCGYVMEDKSEVYGTERNIIDANDHKDRARVGSPTSLAMHDMGLATRINTVNRDASGRPLTAAMKNTVERLRAWDRMSQSHTPLDRKFKQAFTDMDRIKDRLAVSDMVIERAAWLFRKAYDMGLVSGRKMPGITASIMYIACRETNTHRTLNDVEHAANVKRKEIARNYRRLVTDMGLNVPITNPVQCVGRIANKLGLPETTSRHAVNILNEAGKNGTLAGKSPMGLAATALYLSCAKHDDPPTQDDISRAAGISGMTIRHIRSDLE